MCVSDMVFEDNHDLSEILAKKAMPKKEYFTVPTDDGDGQLAVSYEYAWTCELEGTWESAYLNQATKQFCFDL